MNGNLTQGWSYYESDIQRLVAGDKVYRLGRSPMGYSPPTTVLELNMVERFTRQETMQVYGEELSGDELSTAAAERSSNGYVYMSGTQVNSFTGKQLWVAVEPTWFRYNPRRDMQRELVDKKWFDTCDEAKAYIEQVYAVSEFNNVELLKARVKQLEREAYPHLNGAR